MNSDNDNRVKQIGKVMDVLQDQMFIIQKVLEESVNVNEVLENRAMGGVYVDFETFGKIMKVMAYGNENNLVSDEFYKILVDKLESSEDEAPPLLLAAILLLSRMALGVSPSP